MNAIDELVREFAPVDEDDAAERAAASFARRNLREAIAHERRAPRSRLGRRPWRRTMPIALAGALAAVIVAILALLPGREAEAPAPASAAVVLDRTARVASTQPDVGYPGAHQYLYLKFREGSTLVEGSVAFQTTDTQEDWVAPDGSGRQRLIVDGPPKFLTARDRAAWVAAGRPRLAAPSTDGTYPAGGYPAGNQLDPAGLPTEPSALLRAIVARFQGGSFRVPQTFETVGTLLQDSGSPALRAALYRVAARLPGVELLGDQVDALGRRGVAVAVAEAGGLREELLFDPATSDVLEWSVARSGTVLNYFAYQGRGVVDSIEALPGGGRVPVHALAKGAP